MAPRAEKEPRAKTALLVHERQQAKREYFNGLPELFDSGIRYNDDGYIFYQTWRGLPKNGLLSPDFVIISPQHPRADIYARYTRYSKSKQSVINMVQEDGGSVEAAICNMDDILIGTKETQVPKMLAAKRRVLELFGLYGHKDFSEITDSDLRAIHRTTRQRLQKVGMDPETVLREENSEIRGFLLKASLGRSSDNRRNKLITMGALDAALHRAVARERALGRIEDKFMHMRTALVRELWINRWNFREIALLLGPRRLPATDIVFEGVKPPTAGDVRRVMKLMENMRLLLAQAHCRTYRTAAITADGLLVEAMTELGKGNRKTVAQELLPAIRRTLVTELKRPHKYENAARNRKTHERSYSL